MPDPEAYQDAVRAAVHAALRPYGPDAAVVEEEQVAARWTIDVAPRRPDAARAGVAYWGGDEVTLEFGETHVYLWDDDPDALGREIGHLLAAVFAGDFEEAGRPGDSFARLRLPDGRTCSVGAMSLPLPWRLRRVRTYLPYR